MPRAIWKFETPVQLGIFHVVMPKNAKLLSVQVQNDVPHVWALVDPEAERETRDFRIVPTGSPFDPSGLTYVGTVQTPPFVWHVFEVEKG